MDWDTLIAHHPALEIIPAALRETARDRTFAAGEAVFRQGDRPRAMMYVLDGEVRLIRRARDGSEIVLQRARQGFVAEASLDSARYHCDAVAVEASGLIGFPVRTFREALEHESAFRDAWIAHLAREVRRLRAHCERLVLNSAAERIIHYLDSEGTNGVLSLTQSKKAWAAELGLSHEALYRTLRRLEAEGVIATKRDRIALLGRTTR